MASEPKNTTFRETEHLETHSNYRAQNQSPVIYGILSGQGLSIFFILFECFLVATGITECGLIVDSCIRVVFGVIALFLMKKIYQENLSKLFTAKISKSTLLYCIPLFLYLAVQFLYFPISGHVTTAYVSYFLLACVQQLATGFWEEAASKGLVMSGMFLKWKNSVKGRIGMVFITGVLFGSLHILNVLINHDIIYCLWNALYASAFGIFLAAVFLHSESILFCMILHAVWDIVIRVPRNFCEDVIEGALLNFIYISQDIFELGVFPIVAIIICILYKPKRIPNQWLTLPNPTVGSCKKHTTGVSFKAKGEK